MFTERRQFFIGSRYGRSQPSPPNADINEKPNETPRIASRNDRFFLGSRYGKRSSTTVRAVDDDSKELLTCFFTGESNLFRCIEAEDRD
jgi:hypothetical protein